MLMARTDTGKTTTTLKLLDHHPYSFLSDDLTIVCLDGRVLGYPKPLTISRYTVAAVHAALATGADCRHQSRLRIRAPAGALRSCWRRCASRRQP